MGKREQSEEEILRVLGEAESEDTVVEICRKHRISQQTPYLWRGSIRAGLNELRELHQLREENAKTEAARGGSDPGPTLFFGRLSQNCNASRMARIGGVGAADACSEPAACGRADSAKRMTLRYEHYRDPEEALRIGLRELAGGGVR